MKTIAESMESEGVKVLMIVNLDNASGAAIEKEATSKGITTVDYDRYTEGGTAALYVSFDGVAVGTAQGKALTQCSQVAGKSAVNYVDVNGSPTDSNAAAFKKGYDSILSVQPGWTKLDDQSIAGWDNPTAGTTFSGMLQAHPNINAVMVANDGMANAVIADLTNQHLNGQVAVSGQDATAQGLQHILDGDQCFTIYKPSTAEAGPAVDAIAQLANGQTPTTTGTVTDTNPAGCRHQRWQDGSGHPGHADRGHAGQRRLSRSTTATRRRTRCAPARTSPSAPPTASSSPDNGAVAAATQPPRPPYSVVGR